MADDLGGEAIASADGNGGRCPPPRLPGSTPFCKRNIRKADVAQAACHPIAASRPAKPSPAWSLDAPVSYPAITRLLEGRMRHPVTNVRAPNQTFRNDCKENLDHALICFSSDGTGRRAVRLQDQPMHTLATKHTLGTRHFHSRSAIGLLIGVQALRHPVNKRDPG